MKNNKLQNQLFSMQDKKYKEFMQKLVPNINPDTIIGIRSPVLRKFAKEFKKDKDFEKFLTENPHYYFEENNLNSFLLEYIDDFDKNIYYLEIFLPHIDNWATCDSTKISKLKKYKKEFYPFLMKYLKSNHIYTKRFAIVRLLNDYIEDDYFDVEVLKYIANTKSDQYYINMACSWYVCEALIYQWQDALNILKEQKLSKFIQNKSIQKAIESYRIDNQKKQYLRTLKYK